MRQRCNNPRNPAAPWYHDKGIRVCSEWDNDFQEFLKWALENGYAANLTIDRIDSNGNYCPENCRWITKSENSRLAGIGKKYQKRQRKELYYEVIQYPIHTRETYSWYRHKTYVNYLRSIGEPIAVFKRYSDARAFVKEKESVKHSNYRFFVYKGEIKQPNHTKQKFRRDPK